MDSPPALTGPVNLGNSNEFTMRELAKLVLSETGSSSPLVTQPLPRDDPKQRQPDITIAQAHLGWVPKISLSEGFQRSIIFGL
jgi:UDP-glucuronate decarboxylase